MDGERIDSQSWTGDLESQTAPGLERRGLLGPRRPRWREPLTADQVWGRLHAVLFAASGFLYFLADSIIRGLTGDLTVETPFTGRLIVLALPTGVLLYPLMRWRRGLPVLRRLAQAGWIASVLAAFVYLGVGLGAHGAAAAGPVQRAQIESWDRHGRWGAYELVFALADGSRVEASGASPGGRDCYEVRRLTGPSGFAWLRVVARTPAPGAGQLNWPIDRAACFSAAPLVSLRG